MDLVALGERYCCVISHFIKTPLLLSVGDQIHFEDVPNYSWRASSARMKSSLIFLIILLGKNHIDISKQRPVTPIFLQTRRVLVSSNQPEIAIPAFHNSGFSLAA